MALIPNSNLVGLPEVTATDLKSNDPSRLNRTLRLLATQIKQIQTGAASSSTNITNITNTGPGSSSSSSSSTPTVVTNQGTHTERLANFLPASEPAGSYFYEIDRTVSYLNFLAPSTAQVWQWVSGTMRDSFANRPTDLGQYDAGFLFYAMDIDVTYRWTGTAWGTFDNIEPIIRDTHANRLLNYPAVDFPVNTLFDESDRNTVYLARHTAGTVDTVGTAVTWKSGDMFSSTDLSGESMTINGVVHAIATVNSPISITLSVTAGTQTGVAYSTAINQWCYFFGTWTAAYASLPTLGANDIGFLFFDNTHYRLFEWETAGGAPASASPGWNRGNQELPTGAIQILPFGPGGSATGWQLADGTTGVAITRDDATTTTVTVPNMVGAYPKGGTTGTYSPTPNAATVPTIGGQTEDTTIGFTPADSATVSMGTAMAGVTQAVVTALTSGGGGGSLGTDPHHHSLTTADAPITLPADPVANVVVPFYMKR